ncbi:MAG: hypothetical protein ABIZ80_19070 [Bryobacteraceae bacterium]
MNPCLPLLLSAVLMNTGCAVRASSGYRVHDRYHNDYHTWNDGEVVYYNQWRTQNRRDNREFRRLNRADQKRYWDWRHDRR